MSRRNKQKWSAREAAGWGTGGLIGSGATFATFNAIVASPTGPGAVVAAVISGGISAGAGFAGGFLGSRLANWWDEPIVVTERDVRPALLFGLVFSLVLSSLLGVLALGFMATHPDAREPLAALIAAVSGFVPPGLQGVLNNLRATAQS